jgi:hypothetical protein
MSPERSIKFWRGRPFLRLHGFNIQVTGMLFSGAIVMESFMTVADTFTSYSLSSAFTDLLSVEFRFMSVDGNDGFTLDNIDTSTTSVSTLNMLLIFSLTIAGLCFFRKRPQKNN